MRRSSVKKSILIAFIALMAALLTLGAAAADTVYLNDGGHGTGNSADAP